MKRRFFEVVFGVVCALLLVNGQEGHHIDQRILDKELENDLNSSATPVFSNSSTPVLSFNPILSTPVNVTSLLRNNNSEGQETDSQAPITVKNVESLTLNETDTEVDDLLHRSDIDNNDDAYIQNYQHPFEPEVLHHYPDQIDKQAERIEDGEITEDELRRHRDENLSDEPRGALAVVLISMCVALAVLCYATLLLWRRYLENRYGSRTLLVEGEEMADPNDMKHFSI